MRLIYMSLSMLSTALFATLPCPDPRDHEIVQTEVIHRSGHDTYNRNREAEYYNCVDPCDEIMPSAGPRVCDGTNIYATANFLYWNLREEGTEFVIRGVQPAGGVEPRGRGFTKSPHYHSEPGFKVGFGYQLPHDNWDLFLNYTWAKGKGLKTTTGTNMQTVWLQPLIGTLNRGAADWHLKFNNFDLEFGRSFYTSPYLIARPFVGLKGGWHDEDYKIQYRYFTTGTTEYINRVNMNEFLWYFGLRTGLNTNWYFNKSWSFYGNSAFSANWSRFLVSRLDNQNLVATPYLRSTTLDTQRAYHSVFPVLELAVGLQWETFFSDSDYHISLSVGWEEQIWWGHNMFISEAQVTSPHGDLVMHGLNTQIRFDF